jgi:hypothetical protein
LKKSDYSLAPFVLDSIPLWIEPKLLDPVADIPYRRVKIFLFFTLSMALQMGVACLILLGVVSVFRGFSASSAWVCFFIWAISGLFFGMLLGLAEVWDFTKAKKKHESEAGNS